MQAAWLMRSCSRIDRSVAGKATQFAQWSIERPRPIPAFRLQRYYSQYSSELSSNGIYPRVAIIGSGPAGFYTARRLMRDLPGTKIDMYEQLPVPFGLVRFGVAPDHPEVKNCQDEFEQVASSPDHTFIGNVQLGTQLPLPILANHYDAIVFSYGASKDRQLGLEGEDKAHVYSARAFVGWYNGLPEYRDFNPDLQSGETAIVVGQGNVALDVARVLLSSVEDLKKTDVTDYAVQALSKSRIRRVHVVGRRGPMQAAFTIKEVRELIQLKGVNFGQIPSHLFPPDLNKLERPKKRLMQLLQKGKPFDSSASKMWSLDFLLAPRSFEWSQNDSNQLTGVTFNKTTLDDIVDPASKVSSTAETTTISTSTLFRSIGYKAEPIAGMALIGASFNERKGVLDHDGVGRLIVPGKPSANPVTANSAALYCAGWVKRGPTGVIASTMADAFQTAEAIVQDWKSKIASAAEERGGWPSVKADAESKGYKLNDVVDWDGWHRIDHAEKRKGLEKGKPREKFGIVKDMIEAAA